MLCPSAMNHATTLRIMERLRADEFTYQVNAAGNLPLARHGLCSMVWRRRVYRTSQQVAGCIVFLRVTGKLRLSSVALLAPTPESWNKQCQAFPCCSLCLLATGAEMWLQVEAGSKVVLWDVQGETAAVDSRQAQDEQYEDVPYVLIYATVRDFCALQRLIDQNRHDSSALYSRSDLADIFMPQSHSRS